MKHRCNYKITFKKIKTLPSKLRDRYTYNDGLVYVYSYEKTFSTLKIKIWNREENKEDIYDSFEVPLTNVKKIEEISYKTQMIKSKKNKQSVENT